MENPQPNKSSAIEFLAKFDTTVLCGLYFWRWVAESYPSITLTFVITRY